MIRSIGAKGSALRVGAHLLVLVVCPAVIASPLSLTASHSTVHDSNFARTESPLADTVNSTGLQLALNKEYGRQNYSAKAKVSAVRFSDYDSLDNDEKELSAGFSTEVLTNWKFLLNGNYSENLNQFENNNAADPDQRVVKNIRKIKSAQGQLIYGISGIWALVGAGGKSTLAYSAPAYSSLNYEQHTLGLKAIYYSTDLLNYSLGVRQEQSDYHALGEKIDEWNLDLATNWTVSGLSTFNAMLSWTRSDRQSKPGAAVSGRNYDGLTGHLGWSYTPGGMLSYGLSMYKTSNSDQYNQRFGQLNLADGTLTTGVTQVALNNEATSATGNIKLSLTGKTSMVATATLTQFKVDRTGLASIQAQNSSRYKNLALTANYNHDTWLRLSAGVSRYSQTRDAARRAYSGHSVNVSASVLFD